MVLDLQQDVYLNVTASLQHNRRFALTSQSSASPPQGVSSLAGAAAFPSLGAQREARQGGRRGAASHAHLRGKRTSAS